MPAHPLRPEIRLLYGRFYADDPQIPSMINMDDPLLRVMFEEILARAPGLELVPDAPAPVRPANFVVGLEELQVRVG